MLRLGFRGVRGVYGAVERRHAAPAVVGRLGLVLDIELGGAGHGRTDRRTDDETGLPPLNPLVLRTGTATELESRFLFICGFNEISH